MEVTIMKLRFAIALAIVVLAASAHATFAQGTVMNWTVNGVKRQALVFAPTENTKDEKHPVVFAWHGHGGNMQGASQQMHIQTLWPQAIVVYPQGLDTPSHVDPQGNKPGWQTEANQAAPVGNRDLDFFDAMLQTLHQKFSVDAERIYTTGFSNGGIFSYLLWAERSKVIAAIGEVAGRLYNPPEHLTAPRALLAIAGKADTTDPFASQEQTINNDARPVDNAMGEGIPCQVPNGAASGTECTRYASTTQTPVKTVIHPGAHIYPGWAPQEIVDFFKLHKHP
jgi:polyhydroxybutyrate depolymerase